jgi:hypothetical protein
MTPSHTPRVGWLATLGRHMGVWLAAALTVGCAGVMRVDSQVKTHAQWPAGALPVGQVHYLFERLPSQTNAEAAPQQAGLEAAVAQALSRAQWVAAPPGQTARWQTQVSARTTQLARAPWERQPDLPWMQNPPWKGNGPRPGGFTVVETPYFQRQLSVVVRDTQTAQVVYETTAFHDGRWRDSPALWQAMADAALDGFPRPAQPQRQVNIDIPR